LLLGAGILLARPAAAADWAVDAGKSALGFTASASGVNFDGKFKSWQAEIAFDPANPAAGHAKVTIDMASAVTATVSATRLCPTRLVSPSKRSLRRFSKRTSLHLQGR